MLSEFFSPEELRTVLPPRSEYKPYPTASERDRWEDVPDPTRSLVIEDAESNLGFEWPAFRPRFFLEFARTGVRQLYLDVARGHLPALASLVLGECLEGNGRFLADIIDGVWAICEQSYWGHPHHLSMQSAGPGLPDVDDPVVNLYVGETASALAWTSYLLRDQLDTVSPLITKRIETEIERRVLEPCLRRDDFGWMGFRQTETKTDPWMRRRVNNWNAWINSNWLDASLLCDSDERRRAESVHKIMRGLDVFIDGYHDDGACDEGPTYWGHAGACLFQALSTLRTATGGKIDVFTDEKIAAIGRFIACVHITGPFFYGFADSSPTPNVDPSIVYRYGTATHEQSLMEFGRWLAETRKPSAAEIAAEKSSNLGRHVPALLSTAELTRPGARPPLPRDVWMPDTQILVSRDAEGIDDGFCLMAKGGHNAESHNHNDVGSFGVFLDGRPILVDPGVETYNKKTFSPDRYDLWTMQSAYHNLPTVDGIMQEAGAEFRAIVVAYKRDKTQTELTLDLCRAYPESSGILEWTRTFRIVRGARITVTDEYTVSSRGCDIVFTLLTPCVPKIDSGRIALSPRPETGDRAVVKFDSSSFRAEIEHIELTDTKLAPVWNGRLSRVLLHGRASGSQRTEITLERA